MSGANERKPLWGGVPASVLNGLPFGTVGPQETFEVHIRLRRRPDGPPLPSFEELGAVVPLKRHHLTPEEFEAKYGADPADIDRVRKFADKQHLTVTEVDLAQRTLTLAGTAALFARAFAVAFARFTEKGAIYRGHAGQISLPAGVAEVVSAVIGLDERPVATPGLALHPGFHLFQISRAYAAAASTARQRFAAKAASILQRARETLGHDESVKNLGARVSSAINDSMHFAISEKAWRFPSETLAGAAAPARRQIGAVLESVNTELGDAMKDASRTGLLAYLNALGIRTPPQVGQLYDFPTEVDGTGQCIGIIEMGGGYLPSDIHTYFELIGLPAPTIVDVSVAGGANRPLVNQIVDSEVCLDIEVAGALAPGARLACYFAPCTALGFIGAISAAVHDSVNRPAAVSISWSISESAWLANPVVVQAFEEVLQDAALLGVTVCCAGGDYGATSEIHDGLAWVDYPSSSPHILACGGTTLTADAGRDGPVFETAWNTIAIQGQATGGGISAIFALPEWQQSSGVPPSINFGDRIGRGVPDVAAVSDPMTGYFVRVNGTNTVMAGTSSAAPLWCALIARMSEGLGGRIGYLNPLLYKYADRGGFRDITLGNNGGYSAGPGWDACTGLGTPLGSKLLALFRTLE